MLKKQMAIPALTLALRNPRETAALAAGSAALLGLALWATLRRPLTAEQRERIRRDRLTGQGRIVDGSLLDVLPNMMHPQMVLYRYRVAGVRYECTQDVSMLAHHVDARGLTAALELPIQVRYLRQNPGDSIVLSEEWNGLWSLGRAGASNLEAQTSAGG